MSEVNKIANYNQMMSWLTRPATPKTQVADLVDDLEPGSLKDELLKDFDPSQETYEEYLQRKSMRENAAYGGRMGFAKAGLADPDNNVKKGQELGKGITQRSNFPGSIRYVAQHGSTKSMQEKGESMVNNKTLQQALDKRESLIQKYGPIIHSNTGNVKYSWKEFTKDPQFEKFFKTQLKTPSIAKTIEKYNLNENNLEEIFNKLRGEVLRTEQLKRGTTTGEKIADQNIFSRLDAKFKNDYKPYVAKGAIGTKELAKIMDLPENEVSKFMKGSQLKYPSVLERRTRAGIDKASMIERSKTFTNRLDELGIKYEQKPADPSRKRYGDTAGTGKKMGKYKFFINDEQKKILEDSPRLFKKKLEQGTITGKENIKDIGTKLSKSSDEYKKFGYSKDRRTIQELGTAINKSFNAMSYDDLKKYIKKNPKLLNMVELGFNGKLGEFDKISIDKLSESQLRQSVFMEADHIRGRSTINYDAATKKILDGLDIEYPKNLYLIPKMINASVKQKVENWIANNPTKTKQIKKLDQKFKDYEMSYWNRNTGTYGGAKPKKTAIDVSHLGLDVEELLKNNQSVDKPERLLSKLKQIAELRGQKIKPGMLEQTISFLGKGGTRGKIAASVLTSVLGYNFSEDLLKGSGVVDKTFEQTASASDAPLVEEGFSTGEKLAGAGAAAGATYKYGPQILKALKNVGKVGLKTVGSAPAGIGFAGMTVKDNLDEGKNIVDATVDPLVGAELLLPEVFKKAGLGFNVLNKLARVTSPVGAGITTAGILKNRAQNMIRNAEELAAMQPNEQQQKLIEDYASKSYRGYELGGRVGFADGPEDPDKRKFMKIMGGLASLPIVGRLFDTAQVVEKAAPVVAETIKGVPPYFFRLVEKIKFMGDDITEKAATQDRQVVKSYKDYEMTEDLTTGEIVIRKRNEGVFYDQDGIISDEYMTYKPGIADETTKTRPIDEYDEYTVRPDNDGKLTDSEDGLDSIDEILEEAGDTESMTLKK